MAGGEKSNAYGKLGRIVIVLFVFTIIAVVGFIYARNTVDQQVALLKEQREEQNAELKRQYDERVAEAEAASKTPEEPTWPQPKMEGWDIVDLTNFNVNASSTQEFERKQLEAGGLMVVNRWHYLPDDFTDDRFEDSDELVSVMAGSKARGYQLQAADGKVRLLRPAFDAMFEMMMGAKDSGLEYYTIDEGYRTYESQEASFLKKQADFENRFTGEVLIEKTRETVNVPGTSEYQTGLSFRVFRKKNQDKDFNSVKFTETEHFNWLYNHSWEYGIVFRFPVEGYPTATTVSKAWKTGESKSLMVFRYVGKAAAAVMHVNEFCLEEFIEYMTVHPHIAVYKDGKLRYEIYRVADTGGSISVSVTAGANPTASIDNMGGVIVSLEY